MALRLGHIDVDQMLDSITREQWFDWQAFMALEPFEDLQANVRHADHMALLRNIHRDPKTHPKPFTAEECVLRFGDDLPPAPTRNMDWRQLKANFFQAVGVTGRDRHAQRRSQPPRLPRPPRQRGRR